MVNFTLKSQVNEVENGVRMKHFRTLISHFNTACPILIKIKIILLDQKISIWRVQEFSDQVLWWATESNVEE